METIFAFAVNVLSIPEKGPNFSTDSNKVRTFFMGDILIEELLTRFFSGHLA